MNRAIRYLVASQIAMLVFAVICFIIEPTAFRSNTALSYYGTQASTILPYAAGMTLTAFLMFKSTTHLHGQKVAFIRKSVLAIATLIVAALLTPYTAGPVLFWAHMIVTFVMMFVVLGATTFVLLKIDHRPLNIGLAVSEVAMFAFIILSFDSLDVMHVQAVAELATSLLFIGLLYNTLKDLRDA